MRLLFGVVGVLLLDGAWVNFRLQGNNVTSVFSYTIIVNYCYLKGRMRVLSSRVCFLDRVKVQGGLCGNVGGAELWEAVYVSW